MNILVTAASKHGATAEIGAAIAQQLTDLGLTTHVHAPEDVSDVSGYDAVVLGSAVYAGRWLASAKELVQRCGPALRERPVWLFSTGPVGDPPQPRETPPDATAMVEATGARQHRVFAGRLDRHRLGLAERAIVAVVRAADGDFRSWDEVARWVADIADELQRERPRS